MITNSNDLKSSQLFFHWFSNTENIFQHRSFFKMRLLFAIYFIVNVLALLVVLVRARQQSCTTNHCGEISKDIKTLHTEVKNLIALVKDALRPKLTGTFPDNIYGCFFQCCYFSSVLNALRFSNRIVIFLTVYPFSSCKEQYDLGR